MDCLNQIIGIKSETTLNPVPPEMPAGYNQSNSGLFLLEFTKLQLRREACETLTMYQQAEDAINDAILMTSEALSARMGVDYDRASKSFSGLIGGTRNSKNLDLTDWVGLKLFSNNKKGQYFKLKRIGIFSTNPGTFDVRVYKNRVLLETLSLVPGNGTYLDVDPDKSYPLSDDQGFYDYEFVYDLGAFSAKDNQIFGCNCDRISRSNRNAVDQYVIIEGVKTQDPDVDIDSVVTDHSYGLSLDVEMKCDGDDVVCKNYSLNDDFAKVLGWAVLYKSAECLVQMILDSGEIDRLTLLSRESLYVKRNSFQTQFQERIEWLSENMDLSMNDCYVCANESGIRKGTILV